MICSIDPESCHGAIRLWDVLPALGMTALLSMVAVVVYMFRELIGGVLILLLGAVILWSLGLLQVLFVLSFVPAIFYFSLVFNDGNASNWRRWHPAMWVGPPLFLVAIGLAVFAHEETKLAATLFNLAGTVTLMWGLLRYMSRPDEPVSVKSG